MSQAKFVESFIAARLPMLRRFCALTIAVLLSWGVHSARAAAPLNVVCFVVDDLGQRDLGCYGSTFYETPHVDRLAQQGARFTDAYAACPVCSPSRVGLLTGLWPQRTGVTDYLGALQPVAWNRNTRLLPAPYADRLGIGFVTLAERLKSCGYATFFAGKWHLGPEGNYPEDQGFDINRGGFEAGGPYGGAKYFSPYGNPKLTDGPPGEHLPDRLATETADFIAAHREQPFFAYLAFYSVHTPLMARADLQAKYEAKRMRLGLSGAGDSWGQEDTRRVRQTQSHAIYAAMVEAMDLAVGKVLAALDACGLAENTLVIFTSDNGGLSTSEGSPTSNMPLRAGKGWLYEGGIRVPLIVRWPGVARPGSVVAIPAIGLDLAPTVLAAARGGVAPAVERGPAIDGRSLVPALRGGKVLPERTLYWHYPHYGNQGGAPGAAIRRGPWKLIEWFEEPKAELFNLVDDPGEQRDRAAELPKLVDDLSSRLHEWQRDVGAMMPMPNAAFDAKQPNGRGAAR